MELGALAELAANIATFLGIPLAVGAYVRERGRDREMRELEAFRAMNESYVEYLKTCLEHPQASYYHRRKGKPDAPPHGLEDALLFEILICNLESAFYLSQAQSKKFRKRQYVGWEEYIREWSRDPWFQDHWRAGLTAGYHSEFSEYVHQQVREALQLQREALPSTPPKTDQPR